MNLSGTNFRDSSILESFNRIPIEPPLSNDINWKQVTIITGIVIIGGFVTYGMVYHAIKRNNAYLFNHLNEQHSTIKQS